MRLIDADALKREITDSGEDSTIANYVRHVLRETLDNVPTINAVPVRHGRWLRMDEAPEWDQRRCSECGDISCCQRNYCPNCGAKMDGDGDG